MKITKNAKILIGAIAAGAIGLLLLSKSQTSGGTTSTPTPSNLSLTANGSTGSISLNVGQQCTFSLSDPAAANSTVTLYAAAAGNAGIMALWTVNLNSQGSGSITIIPSLISTSPITYYFTDSLGNKSNTISISITSSGVTSSTSSLAINNFTLSYNSGFITAQGQVMYGNSPLSNVLVNLGFMSNYPNSIVLVTTNSNGTFSGKIYTATPPGGGNEIFATVTYQGQTAVAKAGITIP
ncbi:MAG: hypothetical protein QXL94_06400 [Candidatus Parvarchaeum sp.]